MADSFLVPLRRALLVVALAGTVLLMAADRSLLPNWLRDLHVHLPWAARAEPLPEALPGVLPLLALVLIVLTANLIYARLRPLDWLVPSLAAAASILLLVDAPRAVNHARAVPLDLFVRLPLAAFLGLLLAKILLLHRHATRGHASAGQDVPPPLPSQVKDLEELCRLIGEQRGGRVLPLEGRLGEGKSYLVQSLRHEWDGKRGMPVVVVVDVWQQQRESDLQAAILEALYSHPAYLARLGWLQVPVMFLFARWISAIRSMRSSLELRVKENKAQVHLDFDVPGIRWQSHFEQATARMVRGGRSTVIVLDEIDRAAPSVTQSALTLARRSVDVPGVTVLIPYIRSLIRYKAFNPLQPVLPDLGSSMDAILFEERFAVRAVRALGGNPEDPILSAWEELRGRDVAHQAGFLPEKADRDGSEPLAQPLTQALRLGVFATANGAFRERLQERFEEKYLGAAALALHPPTPTDLAAMVVTFESLGRLARQILAPATQDGDKEVTSAIGTGLRKWLQDHPDLTGPPIRVLEGALYRILQEAQRVAAGRKLSAEDVATLAVAAYDAAGLIHGSTGGSP